MTTKGELVRAILFPPPLDLAFYDDFLKSVRVFLVLGLIGMTYSLYMWISIGVCLHICIGCIFGFNVDDFRGLSVNAF